MGRVKEVCQPLEQFYPDPDARRQVHYLFAHRFLPAYFFRNPRAVVVSVYLRIQGQEIDCTKYVQSRWQMMEEHQAETLLTGFRRVTDLSAWKQEISGHPALCMRMPEPEHSPQAYFVAAILVVPASTPCDVWPVDAAGRLFTLERIQDDDTRHGVLCEWTPDAHRNHGVLVGATPEEFVHAVAHTLERTVDRS